MGTFISDDTMNQRIPLSKGLRQKSLADIFGAYIEGDIMLLPQQHDKSHEVDIIPLDISSLTKDQQAEYQKLLAGKTPLYNIS